MCDRAANTRRSSSKCKMSIGADQLPMDVLVEIFLYLSFEDMKSVLSVCDWWYHAANDKRLWKSLWYKPNIESERIVEVLKQCPQLRNLDLRYGSVSVELLQFIPDHCPNLETLHLRWDPNSYFHKGAIIQPLNQIKTLIVGCNPSSRYIEFRYLEQFFPSLENLHISEMEIKHKEDLSLYVKNQHSLRTLAISCSSLSEGCVLPCLTTSMMLEELSLSNLCEDMGTLSTNEANHFTNITTLKIHKSDVSGEISGKSMFGYFPNIKTFELWSCTQSSEDILRVIGRNCPRLQKLCLYQNRFEMLDDILKYALHLKNLTHLSIHGDRFVTDESVESLRLVPQLTHLDLFDCPEISIDSLKVICSFSKLQVLRFDLDCDDPPDDLSAAVSNKNLQIWFYRCKDNFLLDSLRKQHLRVGIAGDPFWWFMFDEEFVVWGTKTSFYYPFFLQSFS